MQEAILLLKQVAAIPEAYRDESLAGAGVTLRDVLRAHSSQRMDIDVYDRGAVRDVDVPSDRGEAVP